MTIEITRHETDGVLNGFTMYFNNNENKQVTLLLWDDVLGVWYSKTKYRGSCSVGVQTSSTQCNVFSEDTHIQDCEAFITQNNLVKFGDHYTDWHEDTQIRIIQTKTGNIRMLMDIPALAQYPAANNVTVIEEGNYVYMYANFILPEHEQLFSVDRYEAIIQNK